MTKILAKSADVLNEADRFQRIMETQMFIMEQETRLYGYNPDTNWTPGEPLYQDPRFIYRTGCDCCDPAEVDGYVGHHVRPMIEEMEDGDHYQHMRCSDCDVSWKDGDECWACGKAWPKRSPGYSFSEMGELGRWTELMNDTIRGITVEFGRVSAVLSEAFAGVATHFMVYDEGAAYSRWGNVEPYNPPEPPPNPFEVVEKEIELIPPVVPNLPDVLMGDWRYFHVELPQNWADVRPTIPLPQMREPRDFSKMQDEIYWRRANPQLTERRRSNT